MMTRITIEQTPNPNAIRVLLTERLPDGVRYTYKDGMEGEHPQEVVDLLAINGITGLFRAGNFLTIDKETEAKWEQLLPKIEEALPKEA